MGIVERKDQSFIIEFGAASEGSMRRQDGSNQDKHLEIEKDGDQLFVVADGMGGVAGGEIAAQTVIEAAKLVMAEKQISNPPKEILESSIQRGDVLIVRAKEQRPNLFRMGATFAGLLIRGNEAHIANVGDSRVYLKREGKLIRLTQDDNLAAILEGQEGVDSRRLADARSMLTQVVGQGDSKGRLRPHFQKKQIQTGDIFILCSDGLYGLLTEQEISDLIVDDENADETAKHLLLVASERYLNDDATVQVVKIK